MSANKMFRPILFLLVFACTFTTASRVLAEAVYIVSPPAGSGRAALMYKSIMYCNDIIKKPACDAPMTPRIFVTPVRMLGGTDGIESPLVPIAGVSAYAVDNGDGTWTVKGQVKTAGDATIEDRKGVAMIVETYCCANDLCD